MLAEKGEKAVRQQIERCTLVRAGILVGVDPAAARDQEQAPDVRALTEIEPFSTGGNLVQTAKYGTGFRHFRLRSPPSRTAASRKQTSSPVGVTSVKTGKPLEAHLVPRRAFFSPIWPALPSGALAGSFLGQARLCSEIWEICQLFS